MQAGHRHQALVLAPDGAVYPYDPHFCVHRDVPRALRAISVASAGTPARERPESPQKSTTTALANSPGCPETTAKARYAASLRLSVAPMMDWTDRHCRYFHRLLAPSARLYTEMVHANAVIHGDRERLLGFDPSEQPLALQLGGSDPVLLAQAARIASEWGYAEVNLNCGCPSDRVQAGRFGACLMREPALVAECVAAMCQATDIPVTVKCRLGVDEDNDYDAFASFVDQVLAAGSAMIVVHARNAWLKGLSPKENREIPPLRYDWAYRLKQERPEVPVVINGGIAEVDAALAHLSQVDGVMLGRAAYHDPYVLHRLAAALAGTEPRPPGRAAAGPAALRRGPTGAGDGPQAHHPPRAGPVPRPAWRARVPPDPQRRRPQAGRGLVTGRAGPGRNRSPRAPRRRLRGLRPRRIARPAEIAILLRSLV